MLKEKETSLNLKKRLLATYPKLTRLIVELALPALERAIGLQAALENTSNTNKRKTNKQQQQKKQVAPSVKTESVADRQSSIEEVVNHVAANGDTDGATE